jgi:hypothetical protein
VLTSFDDYPIHQGSVPIALSVGSDPNQYDRYFFNGYTRDGSLFFAAALGLYPNRHVADAAFSVVRTGPAGTEQVNVHASRRAPDDPVEALSVGPIRVTVVEPLAVLRLGVDAPEHGLRADLTFRRRTPALEEPPFMRRAGHRVLFDYTRLTQFGAWDGWVEVDGERIDVSASTWGTRDRSWGVRPVGERYGYGAPVMAPQFFWVWAPFQFETCATHFDVNETDTGERWHEGGFVVPLASAQAPIARAHGEYVLQWAPGTRHAAAFTVNLHGSTGPYSVTVEPVRHFQMLGIGYGHPEWGHGMWRGESAVTGDRWSLPVDNPTSLTHVHVQTLSRATLTRPDGGTETGWGVLETLALGPHSPTGLTGLVDGWSAPS